MFGNSVLSRVSRFDQVNILISKFLMFDNLIFTLAFKVAFRVSNSVFEKLIILTFYIRK